MSNFQLPIVKKGQKVKRSTGLKVTKRHDDLINYLITQ